MSGDTTSGGALRRSIGGLARRVRDAVRRPSPPPPTDTDGDRLHFEYTPELDGDPDPGEVVWAWVPFEEDPTQGKDRPVIVVGRRGQRFVAVPLTSKRDARDPQVAVGTGPWDRQGRPSYARLDRLFTLDGTGVRREGAILPRKVFDEVVAGVVRVHRRS